MKLWRNLAVVTLGLGVLAGCTTNPYTGEREAGKAGIYGGVGAVTGAVIGAATSSKKDRGKGALIGAAVVRLVVATAITSTPRKPSCARPCRALACKCSAMAMT